MNGFHVTELDTYKWLKWQLLCHEYFASINIGFDFNKASSVCSGSPVQATCAWHTDFLVEGSISQGTLQDIDSCPVSERVGRHINH